MAFRTYVPRLRFLLYLLHQYAVRYQTRLQTTLTAPQYVCLVSLIACLADCLAIIELPAEGD